MKRVLVLTIAGFLAAAPAVRAQAPAPDETERAEYLAIGRMDDPTAQLAALRKFIAERPKSSYVPIAKRAILDDLVESKAPAAQIVAATEDALAVASEGSRFRVLNMGAAALGERGESLDRALDFATRALTATPPDEPEERAEVQDTLGWIQVQRGDIEHAIENLSAATNTLGDDQEVVYHLGAAYEKAGKTDLALDAYIRSAAMYLGTNTIAEAPLKALYAKRFGSLDGLDAKLASAKTASRQYVVFDSRKWDKPAPDWSLKDLSGKAVKLADFKGKLVVMDFWGSWCGPCRMELPKFQALAEKYKDNANVVFLGMNWERPGDPAERLKAVTDFMAKNHYTFPVVIDHDKVAVESYAIEGFPTVYLIDPQGQIRYRNLGYEDGVEQVIEAQLQSMMK